MYEVVWEDSNKVIEGGDIWWHVLQIRWNLWKKNEERQVGNCTKEQEGNLPLGNDVYVTWKKKKIDYFSKSHVFREWDGHILGWGNRWISNQSKWTNNTHSIAETKVLNSKPYSNSHDPHNNPYNMETVMFCIMTFQSLTDHIYDHGPIYYVGAEEFLLPSDIVRL